MYLYLGGDAVVDERDIVGIFDLDNTSWSARTRRYLAGAEKSGRLQNAAEDIPKSFVVTADKTVILTQPNTAVLIRRTSVSQLTKNERENLNV